MRSDAIRHALAAKDFEGAAGLIELAGPATEDGSIQPATWLGWVKKLPEELVHLRPVLNVWYAYVLLGSGDLEAAESRFKDAEQWLVSADTMKAQLETLPVEILPKMVVVDKKQFKSHRRPLLSAARGKPVDSPGKPRRWPRPGEMEPKRGEEGLAGREIAHSECASHSFKLIRPRWV